MNKLIPYAVLVVMAIMLYVSWDNVLGYNESISDEYSQHIETAEKYMEKEIYIDAVKEYEAALELQPENYEIAMKIVDLYDDLGESQSFVTACENAIAADKSQAEPYIRLADYYIRISSYQKACTLLNSAEAFVGENSEITELLLEVKRRYTTTSIRYDSVGDFHYESGQKNGYAIVSLEGKYGLIDSALKLTVKCEYDDIGLLSQKLLPVKKNGEYFYLDQDGHRKLVPDEPADYLGTFEDGYAPASFNGKYGYIDNKLKQYSFEYSYAGCFSNGIAAVEKDGKWAVINTSFENVTDFEFSEILLDEYGFCSQYGVFFAQRDGKYYLYDTQGNCLSDGFEDAHLFASDEPAAVKKNGKWGFVSATGEMVMEPAYDDAKSFSQGYAPFLQNGLWGCIDEKGHVLIEPIFDDFEPFAENGYAIVTEEAVKKYVIVNLYE